MSVDALPCLAQLVLWIIRRRHAGLGLAICAAALRQLTSPRRADLAVAVILRCVDARRAAAGRPLALLPLGHPALSCDERALLAALGASAEPPQADARSPEERWHARLLDDLRQGALARSCDADSRTAAPALPLGRTGAGRAAVRLLH